MGSQKRPDTTERRNWTEEGTSTRASFSCLCPAGGASDKRAGGRPPPGTVMQPGELTVRPLDRPPWRCWRGSDSGREAHLRITAAHFPRGKDGLSGLIPLPMKPWRLVSSSFGWLAAAMQLSAACEPVTRAPVFLFVFKKGCPDFFFYKDQMIGASCRGPFRKAASPCADLKRARRLMYAVQQCCFAQRFLSTHPAARGVLSAPFTSDRAAASNTAFFFFFFGVFVWMFFIAVKIHII